MEIRLTTQKAFLQYYLLYFVLSCFYKVVSLPVLRIDEQFSPSLFLSTFEYFAIIKNLYLIEVFRKRPEVNYQVRLKVIDVCEHEIQEEIKFVALAKKEKKKALA